MPALRWTGLTLLAVGYCIALIYGQLSLPAVLAFGLLAVLGLCVLQRSHPGVRIIGHGVFILLAAALSGHWMPGFFSGKVIDAIRFTPDALPFSMYLNLDKPLIGVWILLACPWVLPRVPALQSLKITVLALVATSAVCMTTAVLLGLIAWTPKWPEQSGIWLLNNLLLVTLTEELLFRGYIQGGLERLFKKLPYGGVLAIVGASVFFGLVHVGAGWQWALLAGLAGLGYGLAYRAGGLQAAVLTHLGLNLLHFGLFTYPMLDL